MYALRSNRDAGNQIRLLGCLPPFLLTLTLLTSVAAGTDSPLADAAEAREWTLVRRLIDEKTPADQTQPDGMTALHWAAYHDELAPAKLLIQAGADAKAVNRYGVTPLAIACTNGNGELVELLLDAGADPNRALGGGQTVLMIAARTGHLAPVKALLARGAKVDARESSGQTALMWAAAEGHADVVQALLDAGADFRSPLASGFTPLLFAVREGRLDVAQVLIKAGGDVNEAMRPERRPQRAARPGTAPLMLAVENGHFELALALLEAGADPNDQRSGFAPLHAITWVRKPNRGDGEDGDPAPAGSGRLGSLDFVRALVARGADVNLRLKRGAAGRGVLRRAGGTPFLLAAHTADVPLMKLLLELGADPTIPNADKCPPLLAAAGIGTLAPGEQAGTEPEVIEAVELLLSLRAEVNAVDDNGETAMHAAAYKSLPRVVELLTVRGAKIETWNKPNKYGWTPLVIAHGYRPGNFKPAAETIAAIERAMLAAGVAPPTNPKPTKAVQDY